MELAFDYLGPLGSAEQLFVFVLWPRNFTAFSSSGRQLLIKLPAQMAKGQSWRLIDDHKGAC